MAQYTFLSVYKVAGVLGVVVRKNPIGIDPFRADVHFTRYVRVADVSIGVFR